MLSLASPDSAWMPPHAGQPKLVTACFFFFILFFFFRLHLHLLLLLQGGDWEAALERFNIQRDQAAGVGIPLSPTGLSRQGTRKIGVLGRTNTINPLTRQATMNVSNAGSKRAQAVESLKQQVEELKAKLQVRECGVNLTLA